MLDLDPQSAAYGQVVGRLDLPYAGDELHHFGWNACSAALCPTMPHPHLERRYLLIPGLRSSRVYVVDTKPNPRQPRIVKTIEPEEIHEKTGYSRAHTVHCGPDAIYVNAIGAPDGDGPGGVFLLDHTSFEVKGAWEKDRGPQQLAYDFWWHLGSDTMITSEWGTPNMVENGLNPEILLAGGYGHQLHVWDLRTRKHMEALDLGAEQQMVLELRPAHDPNKDYGFVGVVTSLKDLSASVWMWYRDKGEWAIRKVIEVPAEPADPDLLPPLLKGFGAVPPLITDINLSLDDKFLYVSCWGTGELLQYDVSDPFNPKQPRWPAGVPDQLALRLVGRAVLPSGHQGLGGADRRQRGGRDGVQREFLRRLRRRAAAPDPPAGRRLVIGLVLLPELKTIPFKYGLGDLPGSL